MQEIQVLFLCLGNICRSPLAEGVFRQYAVERTSAYYVIGSAGTGSWHVGKPPHKGSIKVAHNRGLDITEQRAEQLGARHLQRCDFIVAMDATNKRDVARVGSFPDDRLLTLRAFDPNPDDGDVPDPYGGSGDGFVRVYDIIERSMPALADYMEKLGPRS